MSFTLRHTHLGIVEKCVPPPLKKKETKKNRTFSLHFSPTTYSPHKLLVPYPFIQTFILSTINHKDRKLNKAKGLKI